MTETGILVSDWLTVVLEKVKMFHHSEARSMMLDLESLQKDISLLQYN
jgi:hypothetical protein